MPENCLQLSNYKIYEITFQLHGTSIVFSPLKLQIEKNLKSLSTNSDYKVMYIKKYI